MKICLFLYALHQENINKEIWTAIGSAHIEKSLENLSLGDENNIYLMEEELTAVLSSLLENKIS